MGKSSNDVGNEFTEFSKVIKRTVGIVLGGLLIIIILFGTFYMIDAGEVGVLLTFGEVNPVVSEPGLHAKIPIAQSVIKLETRTQKYESEGSAASKDLQIVTAKVATNFHIQGSMAPNIYQEMGINYAERVIQPLEQEILKATTAKFTAEELITKREEVRLAMKDELEARLQPRGVIVEEIAITNFDFSPSFNQAIEAKVTAEQLKLKADRDLERIRVEAEQKVTQATAEAEALKLQKEQVTPELVQLRTIEMQLKAIEKWDGILPQVTGSAVPFINIG